MFLSKGRMSKKEVLLRELAKEDLQVLTLAYAYAKNIYMYGVDVTEKWITATQQASALEKARNQGYYDAMNRKIAESEDKE